jgi:hypothetical protein
MSGQCCGNSSKSEPAKDVVAAAPQVTEPSAEQSTANSRKSECCNDKPEKSEKRGCGCGC